MSQQAKISTNQLTPDALFRVTGKIDFGRLAKKVEGEELNRENESRKARGISPIEVPHTRLTIYDAQVIPQSGNPNQLTLEEQYAMEKLFVSKAHGSSPCFTGLNKSPNTLPWVYVQPNPAINAQPVVLERELQSGLVCTMFMRVYKPKGSGKNNGVALEGIMLHEPVQYYEGGSHSGAAVLGQFGINVDPNAQSAMPPINYPGFDPDAVPADEKETVQPAGYGMPAPAAAPYTANVPNAPYGQPAPQGYYPNAAPAPAPNYGQPQPNYGQPQQNYGQPQTNYQAPQNPYPAAPAPAPQPNQGQPAFNGYAQQPPQGGTPNAGIRFDPNAQ